MAESREFLINPGILVSICHTDVTSVPTSCIICSVDKDFSLRGKTSEAIYYSTGQELKADCNRLKFEMKLKVAEVKAAKGEPRWRTVLLTRSPAWEDFQVDDYIRHWSSTVFECLKEAARLGHESIAVPYFISEQAEQQASCTGYERAITRFESYARQNDAAKNLKRILIVDTGDNNNGLQQRLSKSLTANQTLRLILIGKSGVGKSCTGNSILRKSCFDCSTNLAPITFTCSRQMSTSTNLDVEVVDTPGLFDQTDNKEELRKKVREVLKSMAHCLPGPHVFLLVFRADDRYIHDKKTDLCKRFQDLFSDPKETQRSVFDFTIVVFTHVKSDNEFKSLLRSAPEGLKNLNARCKDRVVRLDNPEIKSNMSDNDKAALYDVEREDINKLIEMAKDLRVQNGGQSAVFSNDLTNRCLQLLQSPQRSNLSVEQIKESIKGWCAIQ